MVLLFQLGARKHRLCETAASILSAARLKCKRLACERNITERARSCFTNFSDRYANAKDCALARANILDRAKLKWHAIWYDRASIAASKYRYLAQQYADRRILYTAAEPSRRLRAFMNIFSSGGYDQSHGYNLGPRSLLKDAVLGVLMGERLKSLDVASAKRGRS